VNNIEPQNEDFLGIQDLISENIDQVSAGNAQFAQHNSNFTGQCPDNVCI
jgi:hypothetical protein